VNLVVLEIAEGGGVTVLAGEEVLVDAQNARTLRAGSFDGRLPQPI
jgi:hypothetical protein